MKNVRDSYVQKLQNIKEMEDTKNWKKSFVFVTGKYNQNLQSTESSSQILCSLNESTDSILIISREKINEAQILQKHKNPE